MIIFEAQRHLVILIFIPILWSYIELELVAMWIFIAILSNKIIELKNYSNLVILFVL
jgi:hypothetical protein